MTDDKKYLTIIGVLISILIIGTVTINIFISSLTYIFSLLINFVVISLIMIIIFSAVVTHRVVKDKKVSTPFMKVNFVIVSIIFPIIIAIGKIIGVSKNEIRKIYIKLNNSYIYSNKYTFKAEDILILVPHCIQKNSCKLKVTNDISNCKECGLCSVGELYKLKKDIAVNVSIATGGTLARKIIIENRPKAVIAVACERDLTSGVQDVSKIPVLGVFNKRPNGPCIDTTLDIEEVKRAIKFFEGDDINVL